LPKINRKTVKNTKKITKILPHINKPKKPYTVAITVMQQYKQVILIQDHVLKKRKNRAIKNQEKTYFKFHHF